MRSRVDLPDPLAPHSATASPGSTARSMCSRVGSDEAAQRRLDLLARGNGFLNDGLEQDPVAVGEHGASRRLRDVPRQPLHQGRVAGDDETPKLRVGRVEQGEGHLVAGPFQVREGLRHHVHDQAYGVIDLVEFGGELGQLLLAFLLQARERLRQHVGEGLEVLGSRP